MAFDLPAPAKAALGEALASVGKGLPRARWVRPGNLHLTLAFLGEVDVDGKSRAVRQLREKLEQGGGFSGRLAGIGAFPPAGRVRTLWVGLEPAAQFERLADAVRSALRAAEVAFDTKPFRSHITIARCDPPWAPPLRATFAERLSPMTALFSKMSIGCDRVTLFSSTLGSGGPTYRVEEDFPLRPAAAAATAEINA